MKRLIEIPFAGFGADHWHYALLDQMAFEGEQLAQSDDSENPLEAEEYEEIIDCLWNEGNRGLEYLAREYLKRFAAEAGDRLKFPLRLEFESVKSDRIFAHIELRQIRELLDVSERDGHASFRNTVRDMFGSRGTYFSFYDDDPEKLLAKPLRTWDHNELQVLLLAVLPEIDEGRICDHMNEGGEFLEAFWCSMSKRKYAKEARARRRGRSATESARKNKKRAVILHPGLGSNATKH